MSWNWIDFQVANTWTKITARDGYAMVTNGKEPIDPWVTLLDLFTILVAQPATRTLQQFFEDSVDTFPVIDAF